DGAVEIEVGLADEVRGLETLREDPFGDDANGDVVLALGPPLRNLGHVGVEAELATVAVAALHLDRPRPTEVLGERVLGVLLHVPQLAVGAGVVAGSGRHERVTELVVEGVLEPRNSVPDSVLDARRWAVARDRASHLVAMTVWLLGER